MTKRRTEESRLAGAPNTQYGFRLPRSGAEKAATKGQSMPTLTPSADLWPQGEKGQTCETKNVQTKLRSSQTPQNSLWPSPPKPARSSGRWGLPPPPGGKAASAEATREQWGAPSPTPGREGPRPPPRPPMATQAGGEPGLWLRRPLVCRAVPARRD